MTPGCLVCLVPTYLAKLAHLVWISLEQLPQDRLEDKDHPGPRVIWRHCLLFLLPRIFQSAKSLGLLFSSSAARAPSPSSISFEQDAKEWSGFGLDLKVKDFFHLIQLRFLYLISMAFMARQVRFNHHHAFLPVSLAVAWRSGTSFLEVNECYPSIPGATGPSPPCHACSGSLGCSCSALRATQNRTCITA